MSGCDQSASWFGGGRARGASRYTVKCSCGFRVDNLSTGEAAEDTYRWHKGLPSLLGEVAGPYTEPECVGTEHLGSVGEHKKFSPIALEGEQ